MTSAELDIVFEICREEIADVLPAVRARIAARLPPGLKSADAPPLHSGLEFYCAAFGPTDDAGVLGSMLKGRPPEQRAAMIQAGMDAPEQRALIACALLDVRGPK